MIWTRLTFCESVSKADKACKQKSVLKRWPKATNEEWKEAKAELGVPLKRKIQIYMAKMLREFEGVSICIYFVDVHILDKL